MPHTSRSWKSLPNTRMHCPTFLQPARYAPPLPTPSPGLHTSASTCDERTRTRSCLTSRTTEDGSASARSASTASPSSPSPIRPVQPATSYLPYLCLLSSSKRSLNLISPSIRADLLSGHSEGSCPAASRAALDSSHHRLIAPLALLSYILPIHRKDLVTTWPHGAGRASSPSDGKAWCPKTALLKR